MLIDTSHVLPVEKHLQFASQPCLKFEIRSGNKCGGTVSDPVKNFINFGDGTSN